MWIGGRATDGRAGGCEVGVINVGGISKDDLRYIYIYIYTYVYTYIYIYIYTYIYIYILITFISALSC